MKKQGREIIKYRNKTKKVWAKKTKQVALDIQALGFFFPRE